MRVSVVVPVYNPGRYIDDLIGSLRAQTLDPGEFEAVFVDDGSTDGTGERLDRVAAETPHLRVIHIPNSGWPGRPRNVGLDAARGDYVFLSDHDDRLAPTALQHLADFADEHGSDVVVGKIVGVGRNAPARIFERTLVDAQQDPALLMSSLTPQKLYRRAFLDDRGIRFPEGRRRLEDHLFVSTAYLRARRVSVYADDPVYYFVLRDDGGNASRRRIEWPGYFANAAESVAVVDAEAPDEATRIVMRARWLRTEALGRLRGSHLLEAEDRDDLLAAVHAFVSDHYTVAEVDRLAPGERLIGRLLLDGRLEDVRAFAAWEVASSVRLRVAGARIDPTTRRFEADVRAEAGTGAALPESLATPSDGYPTTEEVLALAGIPKGARLSARLRLADGALVEIAAAQRWDGDAIVATCSFDLSGAPPLAEGRWRLRVTVRGSGRPRTEAPRVAPAARDAVDTTPLRLGDRRYALAVGAQHRLLLKVERVGAAASARHAFRRGRRFAGRAVRAVRRRLGR